MENLLAFPMVQALLIMELHQKVCFNSLVIFQPPDKRYILIIVKYLLSIPGKAFSKINTEAYKWSTMPRPFIWSKESIQPFQNIMSSPVMGNELNKFLSETFSYEVNDVEKANSTLTSLMRNCCKVSLKQKNYLRKNQTKDWEIKNGLIKSAWRQGNCCGQFLIRSTMNQIMWILELITKKQRKCSTQFATKREIPFGLRKCIQ